MASTQIKQSVKSDRGWFIGGSTFFAAVGANFHTNHSRNDYDLEKGVKHYGFRSG
jgi:hypothetical protein